MSKILEKILGDISQLSNDELKILLQEVNKHIEKMEKIRLVLSRIRGRGQGIWNQDAQEFVNQLGNKATGQHDLSVLFGSI